jgi:S-adenosylmethionine decarboxylase
MTLSSDLPDNPGPGWPQHVDTSASADKLTSHAATAFAGTHLLIDCWQASRLDDITHIEGALRKAVAVSGATLLHIHLHHFTPNSGVSGVAVLAESHITIHTWPERGYAALDVFMCGDTQPQLTVPVFAEAFCTDNIQLSSHQRGRIVPGHQIAAHTDSTP